MSLQIKIPSEEVDKLYEAYYLWINHPKATDKKTIILRAKHYTRYAKICRDLGKKYRYDEKINAVLPDGTVKQIDLIPYLCVDCCARRAMKLEPIINCEQCKRGIQNAKIN